jgi:hypothetical protein
MGRKSLFVIGVVLALLTLQSCQQKPEAGLLKRYFNAISLNDVQTMSTMALEPVTLDAANWQIISVGEEKIEPAPLPDLNKKEQELKKKLEGHVAPTLDAKDALDGAKDELESARTKAAKAAAQKKVDELQVKYDQEYELHKELQKGYNEAKAASAREEEISSFSLGGGEIANLRELSGQVRSKEVRVAIKSKSGTTKNYSFYLRNYELKDEVLNIAHRGRWVIVKLEPIS